MSPRLHSRRSVLQAAGLSLAAASLQGCGQPRSEYATVASGTWRHATGIPDTLEGLFRELVRYATLAPSTYNSQCWRFRVTRKSITLLPDLDRRSPAVDPDGHHLHVSLGCAAENIVQIAASLGLGSVVVAGPSAGDGVTVHLELAPPNPSPVANAIPERQTTRTVYDGKAVPAADVAQLERIARGPGVTPVFVTDAVQKRRLLELAVAANRDWHGDAAKVAEQRRWTRFDEVTALATRDGLAPGPAGRISLPPVLGGALFNLLTASHRLNDQLVGEVRSAAGLVAFVAAVNDRTHWVEAGRAFQRFALLSTALGIRHAWVNAATEIPALRQRLGMELGEPAGRASLLLRFGYGPARPRSLRRDSNPLIAGFAAGAGDTADRFAPPTN